MLLQQYYFLIPLWVVVLLILRLFVGNYTTVLIAAVLFGAVEVLKARKSDDDVWKAFNQHVRFVGHRGCALNAPENTLASVGEAHRLGADAIEFDITLTADNEPIIFHDLTCEQTTDGTGSISSKTWKEIQQLDASCKYTGPGSYSRQRVPHLREMLKECKKYGLKAFLDMKGTRPLTMAKIMANMSEEFPDLHEWAVVCSFFPHILVAIKWYIPQISTVLIYRYFCGANAVFVYKEVMSVSEIKYWKARGLDVFVWTVNDNETKKYLRFLNVPYVTDDCTG